MIQQTILETIMHVRFGFPCRFAMSDFKVIGVSKALLIIGFSPNESALEQAEARVHRMGQCSGVLIYYLVAGGSDSPDSIMFNALSRKADTASRVLDGMSTDCSMRSSQVLSPKRRRPDIDSGIKVVAPPTICSLQ